jgi:hypothetical protein
MRNYASFAIGAVVLLAPFAASSHFLLMEPPSTLVQNNRGDPQKAAPCGGTSEDRGTPSNAITEARGGDMLHIKINETVFHPGHYRAALAVNSITELPPDPETTTRASPRGPLSVSAKIDPSPKPRCWRTGCSSTLNVQPRAHFMRPTFASPTSTARNARCRSSFGWVNTLSIGMEITAITTARTLRSRPTQRCQSIPLGQDNPAQVDSIGLASASAAVRRLE